MRSLYRRFLHLENQIHHQLILHSISALRVAVGAVFLGFGVLKYFPGISPAQSLTEATTHIVFLGLIPGSVALVGIATLECFIGVCLLANKWMRLAVWLLAIEFVGVLAPLALLPGRLFSGPHNAPTLEGQYVLKDIILVTAALVIVAGTFRGGQLVRTDDPPGRRAGSADEPEYGHARADATRTLRPEAVSPIIDGERIPSRPGLGKQ
jgi:putative oxidoreductase